MLLGFCVYNLLCGCKCVYVFSLCSIVKRCIERSLEPRVQCIEGSLEPRVQCSERFLEPRVQCSEGSLEPRVQHDWRQYEQDTSYVVHTRQRISAHL